MNAARRARRRPHPLRYAPASPSASPPRPAVRPLLLRLLLCVTLLLNGIGSGMASVHVAMMDMPHGSAHAMPDAPADAPCPHAAAVDGMHDRPPAAAPQADDSDCMKLCAGICLQHCHVLPMTHLAAAEPPARIAPVPPLRSGPPFVRANPLLRPPIAA